MFNFSFDRRTLYIVIGILVLISLVSLLSSPTALYLTLLGIPGVLIAITFHEFAHGITAYMLGDNTAKMEGRLSLNPFAHLDPIGTLMLVFVGIGWGKPVHVNPSNYTRKISMEKGEAIVSIAGPLINIILAFIFGIIYYAIQRFAGAEFLASTVGTIIMQMIVSTIVTNVGLGVFNLIPLPPLDGSKVIMPFLPYNAKQWFINNEQIFYIIFIIIWITGIAGSIISPAIAWLANGIMRLCSFII